MRFVRLTAGIGLALNVCLTFNAVSAVAVETPVTAVTKPLQFTSGGHVLGFTAGQVVVATGSHSLRVEFAGAREVAPAAEGAAAEQGRAAPLGRVTYADLWEGITLAYDAPTGGLLRSTYSVVPGADPARIRLRYNAPVAVEPGGDLKIAYATGAMSESAPVAWQQIDGRRVPVGVSFRKMADTEVGFQVGAYDRTRPLTIDPTLTWSTFLGASDADAGKGIAFDASGNTYVTGYSWYVTWGSPIRAFGGNNDAFVAKLDSSGALQWHTFLGGSGSDVGYGIALDASGNAYVTGTSAKTWGSPVRAFIGVADAFVAKLNSNGVLQWNSFLGGNDWDLGTDIALDASGNAYVTGYSAATWGSPIRTYSEGKDAFVAKLDSGGALQWNTFLGGSGDDGGNGIAFDASGNTYVTGYSWYVTWGSPIRAFGGGANDAFVAKLDSSGVLQWHTFLGGSGDDYSWGIALDAAGNAYATGYSDVTWGSPISAFGGSNDAFVAKLDSSGALQWHTFLGGSGSDVGSGIALDASGNAYVTGTSATWGSPVRAFSGNSDAFVAKINSSGVLQWNSFLGGSGQDESNGIALDASGNVYVTGVSYSATWGSPVRAHSGGGDAFVAVISDPSWRNGEVDAGNGWKWTDWFGFYNTNSEPWIYHQEHQWLYPYDEGAGGVFFWYNDMQKFVWTTPTTYPFLYRWGGGDTWLWYLKDSSNPRLFNNYGTGLWEALP